MLETPAYLQRALGLPLRQDVFPEGGVLLGARGRAERIVGYLGHATLAAAIACVYAAVFHLVGGDHLLAWVAFGGLLHFVIGGAVFPVVDDVVDAKHPGFAHQRYGRRDVTTFLAGHLTFGSLPGVLYPALHPDARPAHGVVTVLTRS